MIDLRFRSSLYRLGAVAIFSLVALAGAWPAVAGTGTLSPLTYTTTLGVGESTTIVKTVQLDPGAPAESKVDVVFLCDNTGSMASVIATIKANATSIMTAISGGDPRFTGVDVAFAVASYVGDPGAEAVAANVAYVLEQPITANIADAQAAVNLWVAAGGGDTPEGNFFALHQIATSGGPTDGIGATDPVFSSGYATGWRPGAGRVIVWFGDEPSHTSTVDQAEVISALVTNDVVVAAINSAPAGNGIDGSGQASAVVASVAGGSLTNNVSGTSTTVDAILNAVESVTETIDLSLQTVGDTSGLTITFLCTSPGGCTGVVAGESRTFDMMITGDSPGEYSFTTVVTGVAGAEEQDTITVSGCLLANEGDPCDDGLYCTAIDTCIAGVCNGSGDPCAGGAECGDTCDEAAATCNSPAGTACLDDGHLCTDDECDGAGACSHPNNGDACEDGDACTTGDACAGGACVPGLPTDCDDSDACTNDSCEPASGCVNALTPVFSSCDWVAVAGDPTKSIKLRTRYRTEITGDLCMDSGDIGIDTVQHGSVVATGTSGTKVVMFRWNATVDDYIVTGGGGVSGKGPGAVVPGTALASIPAGSPNEPKIPSGVVITTGTDAMVTYCHTVQDGIDSASAHVDALVPVASLGNVTVNKAATYTLSAAAAGCGADQCLDCTGALCVVEFNKLKLKNDATLVLDGNGDGSTIFVLRNSNGLLTAKRGTIDLVNGTTPGNTLLYAQGGSCKIGMNGRGAGTLLCPDSKLQLKRKSTWEGTLLGGKSQVFIGIAVELTHAPFTGL